MTNTERLLTLLGRGGAWQYYWTINGESKETNWFRSGGSFPEIPKGDHVYFGVNPSSKRLSGKERGKIGNIAAINCLFAEFDRKDGCTLDQVNALQPAPSVIVDSGGGWHTYFLLTEPVPVTDDNREELRDIQFRWIDFVSSDGGAKDLARVLRVPGTMNNKYTPPRPVQFIKADFDLVYTLEELARMLPPVEISPPENTSEPQPVHMDDTDLLNRIRESKQSSKFFGLWDGGECGYPSLSEADQAFCNMLAFWTGRDAARMNRLFRSSGRMREKWERKDYSTRTLENATASAQETYNPQNRTNKVIEHNPPVPELPEDWEMSTIQEIGNPPSETILYTVGQPTTEQGNAHRIVSLFGNNIRFIPERGKWVIWDGTRWGIDNNGAIMRMAMETTRSILQESYKAGDEKTSKALAKWAFTSQSKNHLEAMPRLAKSLNNVTVSLDLFDKQPHLLNCLNGTIDLRTGALQPHDRNNYQMKQVQIEYHPGQKCPLWNAFLQRVMDNDQDLIKFIQRAIGYSLSSETSEQCFFMLYGRGSNGKTVFIDTILRILGVDYALNTQAETILTHDRSMTNDIARLKGTRFVTINELGRGRKIAEARLKELTGSDMVTARFLFHESFDFKPEFKLWIRTNHKPVIRDVDHGIWRRVRLIPFTVTIPDEEQDKTLMRKLQQEAAGIFAWAVKGAVDWYQNGLGSPLQVVSATEEYRDEMDYLKPFIEDCCLLDESMTSKAKDLYEQFKGWSEANGEKSPMTGTAFGRALVERGFEKKRTATGILYLGIGVKKDE